MTKKGMVTIFVGLLLIYGSIQFRFLSEPRFEWGGWVFTSYTAKRELNWPIGQTTVIERMPAGMFLNHVFSPEKTIIIDRFFYKTETKLNP